MLPGFNHNLRHKGIIFHIQTEDNGVSNPYIITHVFFGGNIIVSRRQAYEKFVNVPERDEIVSSMMKEQHKDIMKEVVEGKLRGVAEVLIKEGIEVEVARPVRTREDLHVPSAGPRTTPKPPETPKAVEPSRRPVPAIPKIPQPPTPKPFAKPRVEAPKPIAEPRVDAPKPMKVQEPPPVQVQRPAPVQVSSAPATPRLEKPAERTLDTSAQTEKSLDELILDFLNDEKKNQR